MAQEPTAAGDVGQMSVPELLQACQDCCATFNSAQLSLDAHADTFVADRKVTSQSDCSFIKQVLYGTVRYKALLKPFVESFYRQNRSGPLLQNVLMYTTVMSRYT